MKRIISFLLCLVMALSLLAGCADKPQSNTGKTSEFFQVGYGKQDVSPKASVPLGGYGDAMERLSTLVGQKLYVTCTEVANGFYQLILLPETTRKAKTMLAKDKATAEKVLAMESGKLIFDQSNVIVDVVS